MSANIRSPFKSIRTGAALLGVVAMLSLSACGNDAKPVDGLTGKPTDEPTISAPVTPEAAEEATSTPSEDSGLKMTITYDRPEAGTETSVGEPIEDAEARYTKAVIKHAENGETESDILDMGYKTCGFMLSSNTSAELFDKISEEYGTGDAEVLAIKASGAAGNTICPEFTNFGE